MKRLLIGLLLSGMLFDVSNVFAKNKDSATQNVEIDTRFAENFIQTIANDTLKVINNEKVEDVNKKFKTIMEENFLIDDIVKRVLGHHFKKFTKDEITDFTKRFKIMLIKTYLSQFNDYKQSKLTIIKSFWLNKDKKRISVESRLDVAGKSPTKINWFVDHKNGLKIYDVAIESKRITSIIRASYSDMLSKSGGKEKFLNTFKEKYPI